MKSLARRVRVRDVRISPAAREMIWGTVVRVLWEIYPGYQWRVEVDDDLVRIGISGLDRYRAYVLHTRALERMTPDAGKRVIMRAGGEVLERHNQSRLRYIAQDWRSIRRDMRGNAIPDK